MGVYITGMITGTVCLVFALLYLMNVDNCVAKLLAENAAGSVGQFVAQTRLGLAYVVAIVGAVAVLGSTVVACLSGLLSLKDRRAGLARSRGETTSPPAPESASVDDA